MRSQPPISRRGFLRGAVAVTAATTLGLAAGCDVLGSGPEPPPPNPLEGFLRDTVALADRYDAALAQVPALAPTITRLRDAHRAHVTALAQAMGVTAPATSASAGSGASGDRTAVLGALVAAETQGRDAAIEACLSASARVAPLVGAIAAARATHVEVLT